MVWSMKILEVNWKKACTSHLFWLWLNIISIVEIDMMQTPKTLLVVTILILEILQLGERNDKRIDTRKLHFANF